jgi:hypothetical protein
MGLGDIRFTGLEVVQEVFRKLGLDQPATLTASKLSIQMVDFINDVCDELSDYGNWQETIVSSNISAAAGVRDYSIVTSANVKNIGDIYFTGRVGPMRNITIEDMRLLTRVSATGTPTQFTLFGTNSAGNPIIRVRPTPTTAAASSQFSVLWYARPPAYSTADGAVTIPFPGQVVVNGTLARAILNESGGAPTDRYTLTQQEYERGKKEALNRFKGDTGWDVSFTPSQIGRRRR